MSEPNTDRERQAEEVADAATLQREGQRRLSLEVRFRQNDSISRLRAEVLRSRTRAS